MLPNWECDTDKAKGSAKLGFKTSAAAIMATAYWALGPGPLAFRIISWLATDRPRGNPDGKGAMGIATVGLGFV